MRVKPGVNLTGLRPEIVLALIVAQEVYRQFSAELVITSALDGRHSATSLHYAGQAADLRTKHVKPELAQKIADTMSERLGDHYDVIYEGTHLHIEFQPRYIP